MSISGFGRGKGTAEGEAVAPVSASNNLTAFIDQGSHFEGKLSFKDTVRIDGTFQGEISSENKLIVGESGEIEASIRSNSVVISGTVVGDITAKRQIVLHKTARVQGDIHTPSLVVEEGATFNGKLTMDRPDAEAKHTPPLKAIHGGSEDHRDGAAKPKLPA